MIGNRTPLGKFKRKIRIGVDRIAQKLKADTAPCDDGDLLKVVREGSSEQLESGVLSALGSVSEEEPPSKCVAAL